MDDAPPQPDAAPEASAPADATPPREPETRGPIDAAGTYRIPRRVLLRGLVLVSLPPFLSLGVQVGGLIGGGGLLPAGESLPAMRKFDPPPSRHNPTLLWLAPNDATLQVLCAAGVASALLVV